MTFITNKSKRILLLIIKLLLIKKSSGACYFQTELQGAYVVQASVDKIDIIHYSEIKISENAITLWGRCHERTDNSIILKMSSNEKSTECYRCIYIQLVASNIATVYAEEKDVLSICYLKEHDAKEACPTIEKLQKGITALYSQIILYKTQYFNGIYVKLDYCLISGRYNFKYTKKVHDNPEFCKIIASTLDNCPSGSAMNLHFKKCTFGDYERTYECLGHWLDFTNRTYMVLIDARAEKENSGPKYRCIKYQEDSSGIIHLQFSKDSTCSAMNYYSNNKNSNISYSETMLLYPKAKAEWPNLNYCTFPSWMVGAWKHAFIENDTILYRDVDSYKMYTMKCVYKERDFNNTGALVLYSRSQCSEESYTCFKVKYRTINVIEIQMAHHFSKKLESDLCTDFHFEGVSWSTEGRLQVKKQNLPCIINGDYVGILPDLTTLCSKFTTDCEKEDVVNYKVTACGFNEVYEEKKYRCLGQWREDNLIYAFTQRLDVDGYQCFAGYSPHSKQIFLKEVGESCERYSDPTHYGIELNKIGYCDEAAKSIRFYDPYQGQLIQSALKYRTHVTDEKDTELVTIKSVIPASDPIEQVQNSQYSYGKLPDRVHLNVKNTEELGEELTTENDGEKSTSNIIPDKEGANTEHTPSSSNYNTQNKVLSSDSNTSKQSGSYRILLNHVLLYLSILFSG